MNLVISHDAELEPEPTPYAASVEQVQVYTETHQVLTLYHSKLIWGEKPQTWRDWSFVCVAQIGQKVRKSFEGVTGETLEEALLNYEAAHAEATERNLKTLREHILAVRGTNTGPGLIDHLQGGPLRQEDTS